MHFEFKAYSLKGLLGFFEGREGGGLCRTVFAVSNYPKPLNPKPFKPWVVQLVRDSNIARTVVG